VLVKITLSKKQWQFIGRQAGWVKTADDARNEQTDQSIARTILQQLGGNKFLAMTGARALADLGNGLSFKLPSRPGNPVNYVKITLTSMDLYDLEFGRIRGNIYKVAKTFNGVYFDQLQKIFTEVTGLYTHL
jgi:hypothetical protein